MTASFLLKPTHTNTESGRRIPTIPFDRPFLPMTITLHPLSNPSLGNRRIILIKLGAGSGGRAKHFFLRSVFFSFVVAKHELGVKGGGNFYLMGT